jgi:iron complex transport system ATP-binding protein
LDGKTVPKKYEPHLPILELESIDFRYDSEWIIHDISLRIMKKEFLGILGPNGSGKSTLLKIMTGILRPERGSVRLDGVEIKDIKRKSLARKIAMVSQDTPIVFPFSVREIVLMGRSPHIGFMKFENENDLALVDDAMRMTEILPLGNRGIHELSGGERQRVMLARALAQKPDVIFLDEPTAFQDIRHQIDFFRLVRDLRNHQGLTVITVTHDINLASDYCDRLVFLKSGRIHASGHPNDVITEKNISDVYGTDVLIDNNPILDRPRITLRA